MANLSRGTLPLLQLVHTLTVDCEWKLHLVIDEFDQNVHFVEIDIEEDPEIAEAAGIMGTPCVQFFKNKEMIRTVSGVKMKREYKEFIEENK
ncbi:hypothetical protein CMV_030669 [Castanea mollissima]|uniref:Thioredoxin domain-containing protein n=1 Tax=Castanea mollissima TaxID=60419 RepID=A0A8J4V667_9ROSI|nr:hypothetical protein CMV_030669 [Castanea mollissima]